MRDICLQIVKDIWNPFEAEVRRKRNLKTQNGGEMPCVIRKVKSNKLKVQILNYSIYAFGRFDNFIYNEFTNVNTKATDRILILSVLSPGFTHTHTHIQRSIRHEKMKQVRMIRKNKKECNKNVKQKKLV